MNWLISELHNYPVILCGIFYSILCAFSIVTGLLYAFDKRELNPIELSNKIMKKLSDDKKKKEFSIKMGWVTFVVGIVQGLVALAIFKGYSIFLNIFAILFTIFSICSVIYKIIGKVNIFSIIKLIFYIIILIVLLLFGVYNYGEKDALQYLNGSEDVSVTKIKEGYYFDGPSEETAIIFFPGARVQYTAYAKLMFKFAENGYDCFLLHSPFNLAFLNENVPSKIMKKYNYDNWYLSGHSLGGVAASNFVSNNPKNIKGIISLASYPAKKLPSDIEYISFYGSEDKILNLKKYEESSKYLPNYYQVFIIEGANHSGFANYGNQIGDAKSKITSDEQQDYVIQSLLNGGVTIE